MLFCNAESRRRYCYLCGFLRYNFIPLFVFPVCLGSLPHFLHSSFRIMSHNEIMEKKFRKMVTPKAIPDILRYIIKLPDLSVVCKFDFQHLLLGIVPGRLDHGICPHYSLYLFPERFPLILSREDFCPTHCDNCSIFYFSLRFPLCRF